MLWRVGRALGEREGTGPEDDFLLRKVSREASAPGAAEGRARGVAEGRARGVAEGRTLGMAAIAAAILRRRGIEVSAGFPADLSPQDRAALDRATPETVLDAASRSPTEADFLAALR